MRKALLLLTLICLSTASALTISVGTNDTSVSGVDNITINYEITLDDISEIKYEVFLVNENQEVQILNATENASSVKDSIQFNVSKTGSGVYELALRLSKPLSYTVKAANNVTIAKSVNLDITVPTTIYVKNEAEAFNISFNNYGNTDLGLSAFFKNTESEATLSPQSFKLNHNSKREVTAIIKQPEIDYTATLVILTIDDKNETRNEYDINIIIPVVQLELTEVNVTKNESESEMTVKAVINNTGNMLVNATVNVRTFNILEGFKSFINEVEVPAGESINYTNTLPLKDVASVGVTYELNGENQTVIQELNPINTIPFDFKLSPERLILLGSLAIIIIIIVYFKMSKGRRP